MSPKMLSNTFMISGFRTDSKPYKKPRALGNNCVKKKPFTPKMHAMQVSFFPLPPVHRNQRFLSVCPALFVENSFIIRSNARRTRLLAHRRGAALAGIGLVGLGLGNALGEDLGVLVLKES